MEQSQNYDEQDALRRLAKGEAAAFDQIFHQHWAHIYSAALAMVRSSELAGDIAQEAFLGLWKNREEMMEIRNLRGYLHNCARFLILKKLRRMKVEDAYVKYLGQKSASSNSHHEQEEALSSKQLQQSLEQGISRLPSQQRIAFRLSREQGLTHEQIGEIMGISKKSVKDYIVRAIAFLKPLLKQHFGCVAWIAILMGRL